MPDTDRNPDPATQGVPEGAGGLTDQAGDPGRSPQTSVGPTPTVEGLPAPREGRSGGGTRALDPAPDPAPSRGSLGAMHTDPTIDHSAATPASTKPNPTAPEAMDPGVMPRDDSPPVGSSPAGATGAILSQEDTANPTDPDGPDESDADGMGPADSPRDNGLAESPDPGGAPPLG